MLIKAKELKGYKLKGLDGEIGNVEEFYFDDQFLDGSLPCSRHGKLVHRQQVLISPYTCYQ